jgi:DNA mismatch repair ATPase MutS
LSVDSPLANRIREEFPNLIDISGIRRRYFNESAGLAALRTVATPESLNLLNLDSGKYLCTSAANCLLRYQEFTGSMTFAPRSLRVNFTNLEGRISLDMRAMQNLELLPQFAPGEATTVEIMTEMNFLYAVPEGVNRAGAGIGGAGGNIVSGTKKSHRKRTNKMSLFDIFQPRTAMGARSLRNSLLQPFNDPDTLNSRLDMVELFLTDEESYYALCELLPQFSDIDHVSASMVQIPRVPSMRTTQKQISLILALGHSLNLLPKLRQCILTLRQEAKVVTKRQKRQEKLKKDQHYQNQESKDEAAADVDDGVPSTSSMVRLLDALIDNLDSTHYHTLQSEIASVMDLQKAGQIHKTNVQHTRYKMVFSVQSGLDGLLDVARRTFLEVIDGESHTRTSSAEARVESTPIIFD